jgi:hypothetical protein
MYQFIFFGIVLLLLLATRIFAKRWVFGYIIGGLIFGVFNEVCFEFCWSYSPLLSPMLWRDVPLFVVVGWGLIAGAAFSLSDMIGTLFHRKHFLISLSLDVVLFSSLGYCVESIMSALHFWEYNFPLLATLWAQIMGYVFIGILVSFSGRALQNFFDGGAFVKK